MTKRTNEAKWIPERNTWRIAVQSSGIRRDFYSSTKGRKGKIECEIKADDWLDSKGESLANPRVENLWEQYLADVKATTGSSNYIKTEQMGRLYLLPKLKNKRIAAVTLQDWQNCINAAGKRGLAKKTCSNIRGAITTLYRYCRRNRIQMERPEMLTLPRNAPVGERKILQPEQLRTLFTEDKVDVRGVPTVCWCIHFWRLSALTGMRRGELAGLKWSDIDGSVLHISRSINSQHEETRGKNDNARRFIVLSKRMQAVLSDQRAALKRAGIVSPWVFPEVDGERIDPDRVDREWYKYRKAHNITSSIHELRHTMISVVSPEVPDALLKPLVGHSKAMDTDIYRHVVDGQAERAAMLIDGVFDKILDG